MYVSSTQEPCFFDHLERCGTSFRQEWSCEGHLEGEGLSEAVAQAADMGQLT